MTETVLCTLCFAAGVEDVRVMWTDDRRFLRQHLFEGHGMGVYGPQSGDCADTPPYARLVGDGRSSAVLPAPATQSKGNIVADTNTAEVTEAPAARVKKDPASIYPQVPAEYKNPETGRYLPGKDARHASDVAKAIVAGGNEDKLLAQLGSDTLRAKALKQVENHNERLAKQGTEGEVTVKDEVFDARKVRGSGAVRYDGPKGWVEVEGDSRIGKTFKSRADIDAEAAAAAEAEDADSAE